VPPLRLIAPLGGIALAVALYPGTWGLDAVARGQLGPGFWPRMALIGLAGACAAKFVEEWRRARRAGVIASQAAAPAAIARAKLVAGIALILLYALLTPWLGFALATAVFVATFLVLCGMRSLPAIAANVVIGTIGLLYLFVKVVYLPLPKGDGPFEALTLVLYRALRLF
jgi:putative tricarboxylic transport membrane protein